MALFSKISFIGLSPGANPIKLVTPTPKFCLWRNKAKNFFQSYKTTFITQNYTKRHFLAYILA
jgi:hypothetical protein